MEIMLHPVLAVSAEWIWYGIIGVIMVVSWIAGAIKKQNEAQAQRNQSARGDASASADFAAHRRSQLRELAQERLRGQRGPSESHEAVGLTMAERIERARAQAQHGSQAQTQIASPPAAPSPVPRASASRLEELRRIRHEAELRMARQEAQRQAHLRQQQLVQQRRQQQARQARAQAQARAQRHARQEALRRQQAEREPERVVPDERPEQGHHAPATGSATPTTTSATTESFRLNSGNLRQAFVFKEILDKPLALRDPLAMFDE